jgi:hypothetical protein
LYPSIENPNKGKHDEVISASDLIKKAFVDISRSKDITYDTKKSWMQCLRQQYNSLKGVEIGARTVRLADSVLMAKLRIAFYC